MTTYRQLTFDDAAPVEMDVLRQILAVDVSSNSTCPSTPETPSKRTRTQHDGIACPLCKGHMTGSTCDKCGMEVER